MLHLISPRSPKSTESLQISANSDTSTCYILNSVQKKNDLRLFASRLGVSIFIELIQLSPHVACMPLSIPDHLPVTAICVQK